MAGISGYSAKAHPLEVVIKFVEQLKQSPSALRVYNYNCDVKKLAQGAKWMAVFQNSCRVWHGALRQGTGDAGTPSTVTIPLPEKPVSQQDCEDTPRNNDTMTTPEAACPEAAPQVKGQAYSMLTPTLDVTALSDAVLLQELARRGIGVVPTNSCPTKSQDPGQSVLAANVCQSHSGADVPKHRPNWNSNVSCIGKDPDRDARDGGRTHFNDHPQPQAVPCGPDWASRHASRRSSEAANIAKELVLSADANLKMPAIPSISLPEGNSSLSPNFELSPTSDRASRSLSLESPEGNADIRLADADICLADAVRQKTESVTGCLVSERATLAATDALSDSNAPPVSARVVSGRQHALVRHGSVLSELPQPARASMQGAPVSLQPQPPIMDNLSLQPQSIKTSLTVGKEPSDVELLDDDVLGGFAGRARPPIPSARRRSAKAPLSANCLPLHATKPDAENAHRKPAHPLAGRRGPPVDLNQSLDSLTFFQRHNRSRLTEPVLPGLLEQCPEECHEKVTATNADQSPVPSVVQGHRGGGVVSANHSQREATKHLPSAPEAAVKASVTASSAWSVQHEGLSFLMEMGESAEALSVAMDTGDAAPTHGEAKSEHAQWPDPHFRIPVEPTGQHLELRLFSTWGDMHYIGLSAIEVFDCKGTLVALSDRMSQVTADPHSVNVLSEYSGDPRIPSNLFDGVNCTSSDLHQWLAPYSPGKVHSVHIDLGQQVSLGMLRVWNYNKSRIHSQRGVRSMEAWLGDCCIFQGEISQAPGAVHGAPQCAECIVFTSDANALDEIERHDRVYEQPAESYEADLTPLALQAGAPEIELVPGTSPRGSVQIMTRPYTAAVVPKAPPTSPRGVMCRTLVIEVLSTWGDVDFVGMTAVRVIDGAGQPIDLIASAVKTDPRDLNTIAGHSGDDRTPDKLVDPVCVTMDDRHMWLAPCAHGSGRVCTVTLQVASEPCMVSGLMLWNYNKDADGTLRGVGSIRVTADGELVTPCCGIAVPKAPAADAVDFGHMIPLPFSWKSMPDALMSGPPLQAGLIAAMRDPEAAFSVMPFCYSCMLCGLNVLLSGSPCHTLAPTSIDVRGMLTRCTCSQTFVEAGKHAHHSKTIQQDCLTPLLPSGFVLKLVIWGTWGDPFYVGLTGVEVYDASVGLVDVSPARVSATPFSSVAVLPNMAGDARTPDKLVCANYVSCQRRCHHLCGISLTSSCCR